MEHIERDALLREEPTCCNIRDLSEILIQYPGKLELLDSNPPHQRNRGLGQLSIL